MFSIIDQAGNRTNFSSVVPAIKKFIAEQNRRSTPHLYVDGVRVHFKTSPRAAKAAGYTEEQIYEQLTEVDGFVKE